MAFSGTMVVSGRATGVVVATGNQTELGRINALLAGVSALETPLLRQIKRFGYAITAVIAVVSALVFAYGKWVKGMDFVELFQAVVGIAVSVIPEGLPAIITITLAIGVQRMAQRNAIIRRLPAVETLGSVSRICSDKTGTLTLMEMMVVSAVTADATYQITGDGYAPEGEVKKDGRPAGKQPVLDLMGRVSMLCNDAELFEEDGAWKVEGDPTEGALYPFAAKLGMERQSELAASPRVDAIPFESEHKFMATLHKSAEGKEVLFAKGAPEVILEHCDRQQTPGDHDARQPQPGAHLFHDQVGRHLEHQVAQKEDAGAPAINLGRKAQVLVHGQGREPHIDPVDIGDEIGCEEQRQYSPADAANRFPFRIHQAPEVLSLMLFWQVMLLWNCAATALERTGGLHGNARNSDRRPSASCISRERACRPAERDSGDHGKSRGLGIGASRSGSLPGILA